MAAPSRKELLESNRLYVMEVIPELHRRIAELEGKVKEDTIHRLRQADHIDRLETRLSEVLLAAGRGEWGIAAELQALRGEKE